MADTIQPTPRNKLLGLLADALGGAYDYAQRPDPTMPMGLANPVLGLLAGALPLKAGANVLDDLSYGQMPLRGTGMTTRLTPDATELAMAAAPFPKTSGKAALAALGAVDTGLGKAMFIGPTAKTWDKAAAATAQKLEKAGADPRAIWSETGTFKGPDGKWRQEISDHEADITDAVFNGIKAAQRYEGPMADAMTHPALYQAYPDAGKIGSGFYAWHRPEGTYQVATDTITAGGPGTTSQKSAALHELQHAIQKREGFAPGGSPSEFAGVDAASQKSLDEINAILNSGKYDMSEYQTLLQRKRDILNNSGSGLSPYEQYRRLAGEAEARATQARMNMTPDQRRATFPFDSYDVPVNQLIVRGLLD